MSRRILAIALATVILAPPLRVEAQPQKVYRAGASHDRKSRYSSDKGSARRFEGGRIYRGKKPYPRCLSDGNPPTNSVRSLRLT